MTQTTQTTQQAGEATQQTTSQPAETTTATAPQPEQTAHQASQELTAKSQEPTTTPQPAPKSVFISDGKLPQSKPEPQQAEQAPSQHASDEGDLKAQLSALQARLDAMESQRTTETRTAEVERIIAPLSETLKAVYRRTPFATLTDEEYTQLRDTIQQEVTELASADKARGAVFSRPTASKPTDGKASDKETDEVLRRLNL